MPIQTHSTCSINSHNEAVLSWTVHLARKHPSKLFLFIGLTLFASTTAYSALGSLGMIAVAVVMVASCAEFVFPVTYTLTSERALCKTIFKVSEIRWESVRRCYIDDFGLKLSPLDRQTRLEAFRGVYLRYADNEEEVIETVKKLRASECKA